MFILIGALIIVAGVALVAKTEYIYQNFGSIPIFDRYLSTEGGGRLGYKLIGVLFIFIGILVMTNMIGSFMNWLLSPLINMITPGGGGPSF